MSFSSAASSPSPVKDSSDRSASVSSRNRTRRACTSCRLHKTKCNGSKPCVNCMRKGWLCSYDRKPRHFGKLLLTPAYLMQLEDDNRRLSQAIIAMHQKMVDGNLWDLDEIQHDEAGQPVVHSIVEALGISDSAVKSSPDERSTSLDSLSSDVQLSPRSMPTSLLQQSFQPPYLRHSASDGFIQDPSTVMFGEPESYQTNNDADYLDQFEYVPDLIQDQDQHHQSNSNMESGTVTPVNDPNEAYNALVQNTLNSAAFADVYSTGYDPMLQTLPMFQTSVNSAMSWQNSLALMAALQQQVSANLPNNQFDLQNQQKWLAS